MTQLFVRFYLGVLLILLIAWWVQTTYLANSPENVFEVVDKAFSGPVQSIKHRLDRSANPRSESEKLKSEFAYPLVYFESKFANQQLRENEDINKRGYGLFYEGGFKVICKLDNGRGYLILGPLPQFEEPSQLKRGSAFAIVLAFAALAIAALSWMIVRQLRMVEKTAVAIADGDLDARIDETRLSSARPMAQAFNMMATKTQKLMANQKEMLQCVSHELRTPLSKVRFAVDLIRQTNDEKEKEQRLDSIDESIEKMDGMVSELLQYVKLEHLTAQSAKVEFDLNELVEACVDSSQVLHPQTNFELINNSGAHTVCASKVSIERCLGNLILNAAKYAKSTVQIKTDRRESSTCIQIQDDGPGIPDDQRERIFEPFVSSKETSTSTGLGLAIVKRIAQHENYSVYLGDTNSQKGCLICLELPSLPSERG